MSGFVTEGVGSDQVLVPTSHEQVDHTAGPLSLLDATVHEGIDHTAGALALMSIAAHNSLDHTTESGTNVNPAQVSPAERTAGSEGNLRSFAPFDVTTMIIVHAPISVVVSFGANLVVSGTDFARVNGQGDDVAVAAGAASPLRETVAPKAGTDLTLSWNVVTIGGDVRIFVNGSAAGVAITLSTNQGDDSQSIAVSANDRLAVKFESGTAPGNSNFQLTVT